MSEAAGRSSLSSTLLCVASKTAGFSHAPAEPGFFAFRKFVCAPPHAPHALILARAVSILSTKIPERISRKL
jgi:hypothetical protein